MARREPGEVLETISGLLRCIRLVAAQVYATLDLGSTQAKFLRYIGDHTRISQADLARATATDPALTGRALETLVERGWVRRTRSEEDRRQYILELTISGQRSRRRVEEARAAIAKQVTSALDSRDIEDFERIAHKIQSAFDGVVEAESERFDEVSRKRSRAPRGG